MPDLSKDKRGKSMRRSSSRTLKPSTRRPRACASCGSPTRRQPLRQAGAAVPAGRRKEAGQIRLKSKSGKSKDRGSLADWLTTQEDQGRRS